MLDATSHFGISSTISAGMERIGVELYISNDADKFFFNTLAAGLLVHLERAQRHPLHRRHDEMRQITLGKPVLQVRRKKERLRAIKRNDRCYARSLTQSTGLGNPTGC